MFGRARKECYMLRLLGCLKRWRKTCHRLRFPAFGKGKHWGITWYGFWELGRQGRRCHMSRFLEFWGSHVMASGVCGEQGEGIGGGQCQGIFWQLSTAKAFFTTRQCKSNCSNIFTFFFFDFGSRKQALGVQGSREGRSPRNLGTPTPDKATNILWNLVSTL